MNKGETSESKTRKCICPYCEEEIAASEPLFCNPCGLLLRRCTKCLTVVGKEATVCPTCGSKVE